MRFSFWINKATDTHSEYLILIVFTSAKWLCERALVLHYTYTACLVLRLSATVFCICWVLRNSVSGFHCQCNFRQIQTLCPEFIPCLSVNWSLHYFHLRLSQCYFVPRYLYKSLRYLPRYHINYPLADPPNPKLAGNIFHTWYFQLFIYRAIHCITNQFCENVLAIATPYPEL